MKHALVFAFLGLASCASTVEPPTTTREPGSASAVVVELYDLVTFGPGTSPDWDEVRALFHPQAVVVLRTGRDRMSVFTVEGFVNDFVQFIEQADIEKTGFTERILDLQETAYGDIAQVLVRFDSHVPGSQRPPGEGLDSFELVRLDGRWKIVSITNERPTASLPPLTGLFE